MTEADTFEPTSFRVYSAESISQAIRHYRKKAGLTQAELSKRVGIAQSYLSELESGKHDTEHLRRILVILHALGARVIIQEADW